MATRIDSLSPTRYGSGQSYPIDEWLDGSAWLLKQGEDFEASPTSLKNTLAYHASKRGLMLKTRISNVRGTIEVQAVPREPAGSR